MRATFRSICRLREALSQIGSAVNASAEYTRLSACREDFGADVPTGIHGHAIHIPF
jgi:hypothetical protein